MGPILERIKGHLTNMRSEAHAYFWEDVLPRLRVFSVSEDRDNLLMWAHYGEDHTGLVLDLRVLPELDSALCAAKRVIYHPVPPPVLSADNFLDHLFGLTPWDLSKIALSYYALVKGGAWIYEKEWRVWYPIETAGSDLYEDCSFDSRVVGDVYLGCRMRPDERSKILTLVSEGYPHAKVFAAKKAVGRFALEYGAV